VVEFGMSRIKPKHALSLLEDARQWRSRAEEMRSAADDMKDTDCQATALRIADDYDRMAKHAETRVVIGK